MTFLALLILISIFGLHFYGDFYFQSNNMAVNKSTSWKWLGIHAAVYTLILAASFIAKVSWEFVLINGFCHFWIDAASSKVTKFYWNKKDYHNFFVVVGFDQFIHNIILLVTAYYFLINH